MVGCSWPRRRGRRRSRPGVNPRTVADRLGHARVNVTLDTYSHALPEVEEAEAVRVAQIIVGEPPAMPHVTNP